mmetsp:Transcript_64959/g.171432  ORF Transcript_64959/g.171432 Transcript_64959/m.171432 type:complete len:291 (+) Transcript_64959:572-1444(+)
MRTTVASLSATVPLSRCRSLVCASRDSCSAVWQLLSVRRTVPSSVACACAVSSARSSAAFSCFLSSFTAAACSLASASLAATIFSRSLLHCDCAVRKASSVRAISCWTCSFSFSELARSSSRSSRVAASSLLSFRWRLETRSSPCIRSSTFCLRSFSVAMREAEMSESNLAVVVHRNPRLRYMLCSFALTPCGASVKELGLPTRVESTSSSLCSNESTAWFAASMKASSSASSSSSMLWRRPLVRSAQAVLWHLEQGLSGRPPPLRSDGVLRLPCSRGPDVEAWSRRTSR